MKKKCVHSIPANNGQFGLILVRIARMNLSDGQYDNRNQVITRRHPPMETLSEIESLEAHPNCSSSQVTGRLGVTSGAARGRIMGGDQYLGLAARHNSSFPMMIGMGPLRPRCGRMRLAFGHPAVEQ